MQSLPSWAEYLRTPPLALALLDEWEEKIERIARHVLTQDVRVLAGVPTWMLVLLRRVVALAGAAFTVAPGFDAQVMAASEAAGLPHLPGVATPSDVQGVLKAGGHWVKAFPATALGTEWFRAMRGPFPDVRIVATGGMDAHNAREYLDAGARMVAVGSALADPDQIPLLAELL